MAVRGYDELRDRRSLARRVRSDGRWGLWDRLTAQATLHPGRPQVVTALVSTRYGQELFPWPSRRHSSADYSDTVQMQNVTPPSDEVKRAFQPKLPQQCRSCPFQINGLEEILSSFTAYTLTY
jgi:hypothetical protein